MDRIGFLNAKRPLDDSLAPGFSSTPGVFQKQHFHDYHPETRWCFAMNTKEEAFYMEKIKKNTTAELLSIHLDNPAVMYKAPVFIYSPLCEMFGYDYWFRNDYVRIDDSIFYIISDYAGLRVYDTCLRVVFDFPVTRSMARFGDVYGFHFDNDIRRLISWKVIDEKNHEKMLRKAKGIREPVRKRDEDAEEDQEGPKFNYLDPTLVPETEKTYHNVFAVVHG